MEDIQLADNTQFKVTATSLNLRSEPLIQPRTKRAALPQGQVVTKLGVANDETWWRVSTDINGVTEEGYVASRFLAPVSDFQAPPPSRSVREVHLQTTNRIARNQTSGRAFPLNENGQPSRNGTPPASLAQIINWLRVDQSQRHQPGGGATYCNIYAYDYCYLAGVYLPRVLVEVNRYNNA